MNDRQNYVWIALLKSPFHYSLILHPVAFFRGHIYLPNFAVFYTAVIFTVFTDKTSIYLSVGCSGLVLGSFIEGGKAGPIAGGPASSSESDSEHPAPLNPGGNDGPIFLLPISDENR